MKTIKLFSIFLMIMFGLQAFAATEKQTVRAPNILPYVIVNDLIFISGQLPLENGKVKYAGKLGDKVSDAQGMLAAKLAAENVLARLVEAVGSLDKVERCVKVTGYVNATADYTTHPQIINAASDAFIAALGEKGKHARVALGVNSLPMDAAVEVDAIFQLKK